LGSDRRYGIHSWWYLFFFFFFFNSPPSLASGKQLSHQLTPRRIGCPIAFSQCFFCFLVLPKYILLSSLFFRLPILFVSLLPVVFGSLIRKQSVPRAVILKVPATYTSTVQSSYESHNLPLPLSPASEKLGPHFAAPRRPSAPKQPTALSDWCEVHCQCTYLPLAFFSSLFSLLFQLGSLLPLATAAEAKKPAKSQAKSPGRPARVFPLPNSTRPADLPINERTCLPFFASASLPD
jgi:hypothetical protein